MTSYEREGCTIESALDEPMGCRVRFVRGFGQWVRVTRDNKNRTWTHARGHEGCAYSEHKETRKFGARGFSNWSEAIDFALDMIRTYA